MTGRGAHWRVAGTGNKNKISAQTAKWESHTRKHAVNIGVSTLEEKQVREQGCYLTSLSKLVYAAFSS